MRPIRRPRLEHQPADRALEWLVTNGLGGYASGPVVGGLTRRFHGLLIAALPAPVGRLLCLSHLDATLHTPAGPIAIDRIIDTPGAPRATLAEFVLDAGLPIWRYEAPGLVLQKRVVMPYAQNTTYVLFQLREGPAGCRLELTPRFHIRPHEGPVNTRPLPPFDYVARTDGAEIQSGPDLPAVHWIVAPSPARKSRRESLYENRKITPGVISVAYPVEAARGYDHAGELWSAGTLDVELAPDVPATFAVSVEDREGVAALSGADALAREHARRDELLAAAGVRADPFTAELTLAADQFLISPVGRAEEIARARAAGDEPRTVIAGYHWFTDWGRDTMISLEGLTLATGRTVEAGCILRTFAHYVRDGLIPNLFPEGERGGLYHTADATLWFFHALHRYVNRTRDVATLSAVLPTLTDIAERHAAGTRFGIGMDEADGLLTQGAPGYQLTWMDAKVDGWVVTPRRGKAVEINALWINALRLLAGWLAESGHGRAAERWATLAAKATDSFNDRFWNDATGHLFDVVDGEHGDDAACRPNQIFAIALDHPALRQDRWKPVVDVVTAELLTPVGLRSLSPKHPDFKATYHGDLRTRDAAYHQGTIWAWLIGPYLDAWERVYPEHAAERRSRLSAFTSETASFGVGSIAEIFDAMPPYTPRGCIAQAWSVAEVLRAWIRS